MALGSCILDDDGWVGGWEDGPSDPSWVFSSSGSEGGCICTNSFLTMAVWDRTKEYSTLFYETDRLHFGLGVRNGKVVS